MASLVILLGPTGAGKSVQSELLAKELGWRHISSGDLLRADPLASAGLKSGDLAPAQHVERLVGQALASVKSTQTVVLDGFPRVLDQASWLDANVQAWGHTITRVIHIDITRELSQQRLALRHRSDDLSAALARKWSAYELRTIPVLRYYRHKGLLVSVDGSESPLEVHNRIKKVFDK